MEKRSKRRKIGIASILIVAIAIVALYYARQPGEVALATEVKLRAYEALSDETNVITAADLSDDQKVREWTVGIIRETTANTKHGLSEDDFNKIADRAVETLHITIEAGNIEFVDGQLTDLSKSYISNAVANAISYEAPHADLKLTVDSGNTQYQQVIDMQKTLNALKASNEALSESVNSLYVIYGLVDETAGSIAPGDSTNISGDNSSTTNNNSQNSNTGNSVKPGSAGKPNKDISNITAGNDELKALEQKVEAYYTQLLAEIHANVTTGKTPAGDGSDIMVTINDLTDAQSQMLVQINKAISDIESLTNSVTSINTSIDDISSIIAVIQESITKIQASIDSAQKDLQASIDAAKAELQKADEANKSTLEKADADNKSELQKIIDKNTSDLQASLDKNTKELQDKVDSNSQKVEKELDETKKNAEEADKKLQDQIDKNLSDVNKSMEDLKKLMEQGDAANKQELDDAKKDLQEKLETLHETLSQDISDLAKDTQDKIDDIKAIIAALEKALRGEDEQIRQALKTAQEELNRQSQELDEKLSEEIVKKEQERIEADRELQNQISANPSEGLEEVADKNIPGTTVFEKLGALFNKDVELQAALDKEAEERANAIKEVSESIHQLTQKMNTLISTLEREIRANASAISKLQVQLNQFIAASNGHSKIDIIGNVIINKSGTANPATGTYVWSANGSNSVVTISHEYLKGCVLVEVDYAQQYDITPSYAVNSTAGTLTITVPTAQLSKYSNYVISDIVCYHTADDNSAVTMAATPTILMSCGDKTTDFVAGEEVVVTITAGAGEKIYYSTTGSLSWTEYTKPITITAPGKAGGMIAVTAYSTGEGKSDSLPALATCYFEKEPETTDIPDEPDTEEAPPSEKPEDLPALDSVEDGNGVSIDNQEADKK